MPVSKIKAVGGIRTCGVILCVIVARKNIELGKLHTS
jgi:hypothetical protein